MKKILLVTALLSTATSENILTEKHLRPTMWINEKQFPSKRPNRASRDDILSELGDVPNYDDDRQFPRISDPRFINEPVQLPPIALIRRPDLMRFSQVGLLLSESNKSKLDNVKPTVMISIDMQGKNAAGDSQEACSTRKNYRKHNQNWKMQQPFYVEEPHWIDIESGYTDESTLRPENGDPYIMSRGKKFKFKSLGKLEKTIEDYDEFLDYMSRSNSLSAKNRVRKSVKVTTEGLQSDGINEKRNQKEQTRRYDLLRDLNGVHAGKIESIRAENLDEELSKADEKFGDKNAEKRKKIPAYPIRDIFVDIFETDKLRNSAKESPYDRKFAKQNRTITNDMLITNSIERKRKIQHEEVPSYIENSDDKSAKIDKIFHIYKNHFIFGTNKGNGKALEGRIFVKGYGKRGNHKIGWIHENYEGNIDKKKTTMFERMRLRDGYLNKIENFSTYDDLFIPSRGKKPVGELEYLNKRDIGSNRFSVGRWRDSSSTQRYAHREEPESEEREAKDNMSESGANKDNTESIDARLTIKPDSKSSSGMRSHANYREKHNIYKIRPDFRENALLKSIEQEIAESAEAYLKPRDKHSNVLDLQGLRNDPFFIMRGKKATAQELADALNSKTERQNDIDDVARTIHYSIKEYLLKILLKMTEKFKYNEQYCDVDISRLPRNKPITRNRRNSLDKLLSKYDPFVIIRGKRTKPDNF